MVSMIEAHREVEGLSEDLSTPDVERLVNLLDG